MTSNIFPLKESPTFGFSCVILFPFHSNFARYGFISFKVRKNSSKYCNQSLNYTQNSKCHPLIMSCIHKHTFPWA